MRRHLGDGSSPRPWGTQLSCRVTSKWQRFIPTPVGNTPVCWTLPTPATVHPHARGEHRSGTICWTKWAGSSPRPWGTQACRHRKNAKTRFIPTPVGNTRPARTTLHRAPVHPHARGEHLMGKPGRFLRDGSSPRPWGTRGCNRPWPAQPRFIPTPVGNTRRLPPAHRCSAVHPPRPWGTRPAGRAGVRPVRFIPTPVGNTHRRQPVRLAARFIPTPVGNTPTSPPPKGARAVHPHARGEHWNLDAAAWAIAGSSPRPWGTRKRKRTLWNRRRFIPTPVGNTWSWSKRGQKPSVHPHARGEHCEWLPVLHKYNGSSPRPWGTHTRLLLAPAMARFIPTPVRNTFTPVWLGQSITVHPHARGEHQYK